MSRKPTVFITGGGRGLGRGLAEFFLDRGWQVGITVHTSAVPNDGTSTAEQADVSNPEQLTSALDRLQQRLGTPEVVISNAGVFPPRRSIAELHATDLQHTLQVNTLPLLTIGRWMHDLPSDGVQRLISISSLGAFEVWHQRIDYHTSKAALVALVESLARELAPSITVNSIAPGAFDSASAGLPPVEKIPVGRYGTVDDLTDVVWMFATGSPYITGQTVIVDGGYHLRS